MPLRLPPAILLTLLAACGTQMEPEELALQGVLAFNAADYGPAYAQLTQAVERLPSDHPRALEARVALCRTLAHGMPERCITLLGKLTHEREDLQIADATLVVRELIRAKEFDSIKTAVLVAEERFGKTEELDRLVQEAGDAALAANRHDAVKDMEDLGYTAGKD